jgi:hypothetical protein
MLYANISQAGGSRKVFKMRFFNYINIKGHNKWESKETKKIEKGKK